MSRLQNVFKNGAYKYVFSEEARKLLPGHYLRRCEEFMTRDRTPVHWRAEEGKFKIDPKTGQRERVQNVPVSVRYPKQCNQGLWGGEGIVVGLTKEKHLAKRIPKIWRPMLSNRLLYSEILDQYFEIQVTMRTLDLIDEAYGFDHYILKTHEVDLNSQLGMRLKRQMLLALVQKSLHPDNFEMQEKIYKKYEQYIMPEVEAEWVGLTISQAMKKARRVQRENNVTMPLKTFFTQQLVQKLTDGEPEEPEGEDQEKEVSWTTKLNPFASKKSDKS